MAARLGALYDALLDAGASVEHARRAAEEVADYEARVAATRIEAADLMTTEHHFLIDGRPYLNARQAAIYCGYEPAPLGTLRKDDRQMACFFSWAHSHGLKTQTGRAIYRRTDLDAAIQGRRVDAALADQIAMAQHLARQDVADRRRRSRLQLRRNSESKE